MLQELNKKIKKMSEKDFCGFLEELERVYYKSHTLETVKGRTPGRLEKVKEIIKEYVEKENIVHGLYARDKTGDPKTTIYSKDELIVNVCYDYGYFEVHGLSLDEFCELAYYYEHECVKKVGTNNDKVEKSNTNTAGI